MTEMNRLIAYIAQPPIDDALDARIPAGANFGPTAMCNYCQRLVAGGEHQDLGDNVTSIFTSCHHWNGCVVCSFCGVAVFDTLADYAVRRVGQTDCPECGAVDVCVASDFMLGIDERVERSRESFVEWDRKVRCLEMFGVATGMAIFAAREDGAPLLEEELHPLFHAILDALRLPETDESANRFFDRAGEAISAADRLRRPERPSLRLAPRLDAEITRDDELR